ncbi:MAG: hypothetical protein M3Q08_01520 [Pseudomonadota bacterium]|nr:hypothetical protein [Pseudomonadota bacterium]
MPKAFQQPKLAASAEKLARIYYDAQQSGKFSFESSAWKPAKGALKKDTGGKCAYCEASTDVVAHGDVEHFRPKSIYWWLAFVFDNYLFSCQICNQTYKGDKFPISGTPALAPVMPPALPSGQALSNLLTTLVLDPTTATDAHLIALWAAEDADLPNPYLEDPEPFFTYEADDRNREIWMRSAGGLRADRAFAAADTVLGLNREELRRLRYADYRPFFMLRATLDQLTPDLRREVLRELRVQQGRRQPFAGMKRFFAKKWALPGPF